MTYEPESTYPADFFTHEYEGPDGWRLPLRGNVTSWIYVSPLDFAFEVWLGGDFDVTVRLERPFTYGPEGRPVTYDPRATRKRSLAPLLGIGNLTVAEFLVKHVGELEISFTNGRHLGAGPADDGEAWRLEWPVDGSVGVAARPGGGLLWPGPGLSAAPRVSDGPTDGTDVPEPIHRGRTLELPIRGLVRMSSASGVSIELLTSISGIDAFDVHFGGGLEIVDAARESWRGRGDTEDLPSLGPVLDLVGNTVTGGHIDEGGRLHLEFADGTRLIAESDRWEAHWPMAPGYSEEHWVPREGPSIP